MHTLVEQEQQYSAQNLNPLPIVLHRGEDCWLWDINDKKYLDCSSALMVNNFGHCHPKIVKTAQQQVATLTMVSRLFYNDQLPGLLQQVCELTHMDQALPMNSGAEAFETAVKAARRWGYQVKGVAENQAEVILCNGNFHGRTVTAIGASDNPTHQNAFSPFTPGFALVPFNDAEALEHAITPNTAAFIVEPIQGERGVILPKPSYLQACAAICKKHNVLLICDEIQTGVGRTGTFLTSEQEGIEPDAVLLGKGLGGGILPISMLAGKKHLMDVFTPGSHGSTFSGSPFASAVSKTALAILAEEQLCQNANIMGDYFVSQLHQIQHPAIAQVRGRGLLIAMEFHPDHMDVPALCKALAEAGLLVVLTRGTIFRIAPPLTITKHAIDHACTILAQVLKEQV